MQEIIEIIKELESIINPDCEHHDKLTAILYRLKYFSLAYNIEPIRNELIVTEPEEGRKRPTPSNFIQLPTGELLYQKKGKS